MSDYLVTGTVQLDASLGSAAVALTQLMQAYISSHRKPAQLPALTLSSLDAVDWGAIWRSHTELRATHQTVALVHTGSLGDVVSPGVTVADLANDWSLSTIVIVPVCSQTVSIAVAYAALARQARAVIAGVVLWGAVPESLCESQSVTAPATDWLAQAIADIDETVRVPVLGHVPVLPEDMEDRAALADCAASSLNWEFFPW